MTLSADVSTCAKVKPCDMIAIKRRLNQYQPDCLIWDVDNTLVDTSRSQVEAIWQTAEYYLGRKVAMSEVEAIKARPDMNNDWDATYALVSACGVTYQDMQAKYQQLYLGTDNKPGLIAKETLLIPIDALIQIKNRFGPMTIVTGRPRKELEIAINQFGLANIFAKTVCLEDASPKPSPDPLYLAMRLMNSTHPVYIGDSLSDQLAADKANIMYIGIQKGIKCLQACNRLIMVPDALDIIQLLL